MAGVQGRWSDVRDEKVDIQPVSTIKGWVGDTGYGTLLKKVEDQKSFLLQTMKETEGETGEGKRADNGEGGA